MLTSMKRSLHPISVLLASTALVVLTSASSASAAASQSIAIDNFAFTPAEVTVPVGGTLAWTNNQNVRHTTTADNGAWDSGILTSGQSFEFTFNTAGDFTYHCDIHEEMVGVVHVVAAAAAPAPAPAPEPEAAVESPEIVTAPAAADVTVVAEPAPVAPAAPAAPAPVAPTPKPTSNYYGY